MRLHTFGGLWIEAEPPVPPLGRRRMGLLALVAVAGRRGITRERVVGILWGETDEEAARHTLSQNLYSLRRETGRDLIVGTTALQLDPAVTTDVGEFQDALAIGDLSRAVELYTGDFLEGFYLPGAPEFERWVEEERARLKAAGLRALEILAHRAEQAGDPHQAIRWQRRLAELDPLSAQYAAGLMRSLAAAGDHPAALAHVRGHEEAVRRELDADLDPTVRALVASLKGSSRVPTPVHPPPSARPRPDQSPVPPTGTAPTPFGLEPIPWAAEPSYVGTVVRRRRVTVLMSALLIGTGAFSAVVVQWIRSNAAPPQPSLAVGLIRTTDTSAGSGILRDMLATSLGSIRGLQIVANSRLIELMPRGADTVPGAIADAARRAGADQILEAEVLPRPSGLALNLRRVDLESGVVRQGYTVQAADPARLIDSATAAIVRDLRLPAPASAVATIRTASSAAYALYEEGLRTYYKWDDPGAYRLMRAALELDSSFAMAAWYAWSASKGLGVGPDGDLDLLRHAKLLAPRAIDRERLIIAASVAAHEAPAATALAIAETLTVRYPDDPDGHILLGTARHASGDFAGSVAAHERAVAMDSAAGTMPGSFCRMCQALRFIVNGYLWWDSLPTAERTARRFAALRPEEATAWYLLVEPLLRQGRRAEAVTALQKADSLAIARGQSYRGTFYRDMIRWGEFEELDRLLLDDLRSPSLEVRSEGRWLMLLSLRNQGRLREALALARDNVIPGSSIRVAGLPPEGMMQAALLMETGQPLEAARRFRQLASTTLAQDRAPGFRARFATWVLTLGGTALAAAGDTAAVRRLADSAEVIGRESNWGRDLRLHYFLRGLILQGQNRHALAVDAFRRAVFSTTDGYTRINLELARSLMALGRAPEAIAILQPALRGGVDGGNTYVTHTELHEALAQAFERAGRADSAAAHYHAVERAWRRADHQFADRLARARSKASYPVTARRRSQ